MKNTCVQLAVLGILFFWQSIVLAQGENQSAQIAGAKEEITANANWADMVFGDGMAPAQAANRVTLVHEDVAGDTKVGRCGFGTPLRLGEKTYTRGIGVNSRSVLRVSTAQPAARFVADIGLDRNVDNTAASVTMHVTRRRAGSCSRRRCFARTARCRPSTCRSTARRASIWSSTTAATGAVGTRRTGPMRA